MLLFLERQQNNFCIEDRLYVYLYIVKNQPGTACPLELTDTVRRQAEKVGLKADLFLIVVASIVHFLGALPKFRLG